MNNFKIELVDAEFEFLTMHTRKLHAFQVYVMHNDVKHRFHMQISDGGAFHITDPDKCPEVYRHLEPIMSEAIMRLGGERN